MNRRPRLPCLLLGALLLGGCSSSGPHVDSQRYLADVAWMADDARGGRDTGSPELFATADWVADKFHAAGLQPAGDNGTYLQHFTVKGNRQLTDGNQLSVAGRALALQTEYMPLQTALTGSARAAAVFAGYGITDSEGGRDDYAGLDVKGKVVLVLRGGPHSHERRTRYAEGGKGRERATYAGKVNSAFQHGAAALLVINDPLGCPPDSREDELPSYRALPGEGVAASLPAARLTAKVGLELFAARQLDLRELQRALDGGEPRGQALEGVTVVLEVRSALTDVATVNVLGYLPGHDATLGGEYVLVGAHMDHLGRGTHLNSLGGPSAIGQIHNGADDNASGTAGVIELAGALAQQQDSLRRGVMFAAWSGEEWGLLGSQHYTEAPTKPLDDLVAVVNMDMIGRSKNGYLIVEGMGTSPGFHDLVVRAEGDLNQSLDLHLADRPSDNSDHASFVHRNIPVLNFFTGTHDDYHKPSDDTDKINAEDGARIASLAGECALLLANADVRPPFTDAGLAGPTGADSGNPHAAAGPGAPKADAPVPYRVVFGTTPDMAYQQEDGVRISGVRAGTPSEQAGLKAGDVITAFDGHPVKNLQDYAVLLFAHKPGDEITVTVRRGTETLEFKAILTGQAGEG